jgi:SAM-dependent methyltransferase
MGRVAGWSARARDRVRGLSIRAAHRGRGLPLPPSRLMHLVAASEDVAWFLEGGARAAASLRAILGRHGVAPEGLGAILDFGCGCGRVMRHWESLRGPALHGTDYNPALVAWCAKNLPFARFRVNGLVGGVDYEDGTFDLVYALSVFTHLAGPSQEMWIGELARVLRPGGYLFFSTHGEHYAPRLPEADRARFRAGRLVVVASERAGSNACAAFHPETYVRGTLAPAARLEVVDFVPEGATGNPRQDAYLLRKPGPSP